MTRTVFALLMTLMYTSLIYAEESAQPVQAETSPQPSKNSCEAPKDQNSPAEQTPMPDASYTLSPSPAELGEMPFGTRKQFSIRVMNQSEKPLTIKKVRPSCACLKSEGFSEEPIKPGESGEIRGLMIADEKEGQTRKLFYVHLSDEKEPIAQVVVNVEFIEPQGPRLVVSGKELEFGNVPADAKKRLAVIRLMNFGDSPLEITEIVGGHDALTLKLDSDEPVAPHKGVTLRAWLDVDAFGEGELNEEIFLMSNSPLTPAVALRITGLIRKEKNAQ